MTYRNACLLVEYKVWNHNSIPHTFHDLLGRSVIKFLANIAKENLQKKVIHDRSISPLTRTQWYTRTYDRYEILGYTMSIGCYSIDWDVVSVVERNAERTELRDLISE